MPPRKGPRNVVKSGNAGNSTKSKPVAPVEVDPTKPVRPPPLFPNYKTPLELLQEKCQKNGWERPVVDTVGASVSSKLLSVSSSALGDAAPQYSNRSEPPTWTAAVTLRKRVSKNVYNLEEVKFVPIPRIQAPDAVMAKHLGATYAMFRVGSRGLVAMGRLAAF